MEYDCPTPPRKTFKNRPPCKQFVNFISETLSQKLKTGTVAVWGKVGEVQPPHLVLPITVEPSKPRLCIDARFLNLWMKDTPFSLDKLIDVPRFVYKTRLCQRLTISPDMTISCSLKNRLNTSELNETVCGGCVLPCPSGGRTPRMCTRRLASLGPTSLDKKISLVLSI